MPVNLELLNAFPAVALAHGLRLVHFSDNIVGYLEHLSGGANFIAQASMKSHEKRVHNLGFLLIAFHYLYNII